MSLKNKNKDELLKIADDLGIDFDKRMGEEKLRKELEQHMTGVQKQEDQFEKAPFADSPLEEKPSDMVKEQPKPKHTAMQRKPIDPGVMATPENVKEALKVHVDRGLHIVQLDNEGWYFQRGGKEDCGNMKMPLKQIVRCASKLVQVEMAPSVTQS